MDKKEEEKAFNKVIELMEEGKSVRQIFRENDLGIKRGVFNKWIETNEEYQDHYARAMLKRADVLFDEIIEIADKQEKDVIIKDGAETINHNIVNRNRLQIDARKWVASKMNPKKYGEKLDVTTGGKALTDLSKSSTEDLVKRAQAVQDINSKPEE